MIKLSIIIPVWHEEKTIEKVVNNILKNVKTKHEILAVYDLLSDPTLPVLKQINKRYKTLNVVKNNVGNGRGVINAIKTGIQKAKGQAILITMADMSDDIKQTDLMYKSIEKGYDIVAASRYMKGGKKIGGPVLKSILSKISGLSLYYLFKVPTHDSTNAYKMYRRSIFKKIKIKSTGGFEYSLEITLKAFKKGFKITEIPTLWRDRESGKSNFKLLSWLPNYIKTYFIVIRNK